MSNEELVNETLTSLIEFLPNVIEETRNTAALFHSDREATALGKMVHLIDAYTWIIDAVGGIKKLGYLQQLNLDPLPNFLKDIEQAMSIQDFVAVSDILEYELVEIFESWMNQLKERIGDN